MNLKNLSPRFDEVYLMDQGERGRSPSTIFRTAICRACGEIANATESEYPDNGAPEDALSDKERVIRRLKEWLWDVNNLGPNKPWPTLRASAALGLRKFASYRGLRLINVGFRNMLQRETSTEAFKIIRGGIGFLTITSEWNAAEALVRFLNESRLRKEGRQSEKIDWEITKNGPYRTLRGGMGQLLTRLNSEAERGFSAAGSSLTLHLRSYVKAIKHLQGNGPKFSIEYRVSRPGARDPSWESPATEAINVTCDNLFLCIPRASLEKIRYSGFKGLRAIEASSGSDSNSQDGAQPVPVTAAAVRKLVQSVDGRPLLKIVCTFSECWWAKSMGLPDNESHFRKVLTDTSLSQIFLAHKKSEGRFANAMMIYVDGDVAEAWDVFRDPAISAGKCIPPLDASFEQKELGGSGVGGKRPDSSVSGALFEEIRFLLARIFEIEESEIPRPTKAAIQSWNGLPYHAGWHSWHAGSDSIKTREWLARPLMDTDVKFGVAGESYSTQQGWIEGAFRSAELSLIRNGVAAPAWLEGAPYLESSICGCKDLDELLIY